MALPFGVSWICTLLLWGCICFPPQKGYNIAHGYSLNEDEFSSHVGVLGPQTSNQFHSGASLNTNHDSFSPRDEMQAMRLQNFVSLESEPVHRENNEDASSVTSLSEEMVQSKPDSGHEPDKFLVAPSAPPEHESYAYRHPFGFLVKEHTQQKTMEGISFPTINDFKQFIETMKRSFLMPGSDLSKHFQTAQEVMENEIAFNAQNIEGEPDTSYRSNSAQEGTAHDDAGENEVWSEPINTVFEQGEQGANYQMPRESLFAPDPINYTASLISTSVYDNQDSGLDSALYPHHHLAAPEHVSSNYGSFDNGGISGENHDIFTNAPDVGNEDIQSTSYKLPEQIPSGLFFGEGFSFSGQLTASPVNPPNSPSQDFSYYSSETSNITPLTSEKNIQQPNYTTHGKDSLTGYQKPSGGFELGEDFQSEELGRVTPANVLSAPKPPSLNSYGKSLYVSASRGQLYIPDKPKHRGRQSVSFQAYQPAVGKESKDINYTPTVHLRVSSGSVSSGSENLSPQSSSGHVGVQTSSPHDAQNEVRSHPVFTVKPSSSLHGSSRHDGYLGDQRVSVNQAKDEEKSDPSKQNLVSAIQEPKQMTDNTLIPISIGLDSTQSGISSQVGGGYGDFNSLTNLAPTSALERAFSRLVGNEDMSRNFGIKNKISDRFPTGAILGARNPQGSFSTPQRRGISGYVGATRAGLLQTSIQPSKVRKRPANVNKEPGNMAYWPPKPLSAAKVSGSTLSGVFRRNGGNTKRLPPQTGSNMSPSVNTHVVKSRNSYVRGKVSLSKTRYTPYQLDEGKTGKHQWDPRQRKYKNTISYNVKGFEEQ
ncbi:uncharacterized protein LOC122874890 [Siniperca chuatsi]|uniref:uncharacterized protein LOC122874890 n=1 Tax=Siniperca chuatsi TaxID=119488 RepID=UPI001CE07E45|nr:uncharacterized protein LOC122874890 [Siniperca chuatsi]